MEIFKKENNLLKFTDWNNVEVVFTTNSGGTYPIDNGDNNLAYQVAKTASEKEGVLKNRELLAASLNCELDDFIFCEQLHTDQIQQVTNEQCGSGKLDFESGVKQTDGLFTFEKNIVLACFYADCTPIYLYSEPDQMIAVVHAGWQGTVKSIAYKAVKKIVDSGVNVENIQAVIGPCISQENFEVQDDVIQAIKKLDYIDYEQAIKRKDETHYLVDNKMLNKLQLQSAGIKPENIKVSTLCTYDQEDLFSFRKNNETGRMLACIFQK